MIVANGCPKSGTHALMAWLQRMGLNRLPGIIEAWHADRTIALRETGADSEVVTLGKARQLDDRIFCHAHVHAGHRLDGFRVVTIFRDPRNVLVSYVRHQERVRGERITLQDALRSFCGRPFVEVYRGFLGWRGRSLCLRYEDFPPGFCGNGAGLYAHADRDHNTRTGSPSNWLDWWTEEMDLDWQAAGGPGLVEDAGYGLEDVL